MVSSRSDPNDKIATDRGSKRTTKNRIATSVISATSPDLVKVNWFPVTYILANLIINSIHAWLTKDYMLSGMRLATLYCLK